jgi:hypothetical protein
MNLKCKLIFNINVVNFIMVHLAIEFFKTILKNTNEFF